MKRALVLFSLLLMAACAPVPPPPPPPAPSAMPPAAEAPPPPMAMPNTYIVFFDWNRAWLSPAGMQILQQAANAYQAMHPVVVHVTGYTDTSGSYRYNMWLSWRRARNVAAALMQMGVPQQALAILGRGENDLRVPTPPGVREPQNRRVEVVEDGAPGA